MALSLLLLLLAAAARARPREHKRGIEGGWLSGPTEVERTFDTIGHGMAATSKWAHYFDIYQHHAERFRGTDAVIVEVGVSTGGSLWLWRKYFGESVTIIGIDLFNSSFMQNNPLYGSPKHMFYGDQADPAFWAYFRKIVPRVDLFIDDGGHSSLQQVTTIREMLPHLAPGGLYVCEDIQQSRLTSDSVVHEAINAFVLGEEGLYKFKWGKGPWYDSMVQRELPRYQRELFSVSFYAHVLVVEKLTRPRTELWPCDRGDILRSGTRPRGTAGAGRNIAPG
jgi:hypothetical protein